MREPQPLGGAERQSGHIARALAERGFRVRHVVFGEGLCAERAGVEVVQIPSTYLRGGVARRRAAVDALRIADARLYIQRSAGFETGVVGGFARACRRRFVFSSSSEVDFSTDPVVLQRAGVSLDEWPTRLQYLVGLRLAHAVVTQTDEQRAAARRNRGIDARSIPSFCQPASREPRQPDAFLWIGGISAVKNPVALVDLAASMPEARFLMVTTDRPGEPASLVAELRSRAASVPNLEMLPPAGPEQVLALYARAVAVVNTSWFEGFPNTFLEGWARGVPALSLSVDPDGVIERHGLGASCGGSLERLVEEAGRMWSRRDGFDGERLRSYVESTHHPDIVGAQWAELVEELLAA